MMNNEDEQAMHPSDELFLHQPNTLNPETQATLGTTHIMTTNKIKPKPQRALQRLATSTPLKT
jgi:hypothetical protein